MEEHLDSITRVLAGICSSDLASHESLATLDCEKLLDGPGAEVWEALISIMVPLQGEEAKKAMQGVQNWTVTRISVSDETALVKVESFGHPPEPFPLAKIEGKWIPVQVKNAWHENITKARDSLGPLNVADSEVQESLELLGKVEAHLDGMLAAQTNAEFSPHLTRLVGELSALAPAPASETTPPVPIKPR